MNILRPKEMAQKFGISSATLWRRVKQDSDFPRPVRLSPGMTGFVESQANDYLDLKIKQSQGTLHTRASAFKAAAASVAKRSAETAGSSKRRTARRPPC